MGAHPLALLKCREREDRREERHRLASPGRRLRQRDERFLRGRGVERLGDDAREPSLLLAERRQRALRGEQALDEIVHRADLRHASSPEAPKRRVDLELRRGKEERVQLRGVLAPVGGETDEPSIDRRNVRGERPLAAQMPERKDRPWLRMHVAKAPCETENAPRVHGFGAIGKAHGEPLAAAERKPAGREAGPARDRDDEGLARGLGGEARDERLEAVLVHPALLDVRSRPAHVADGVGRPTAPGDDDRARGGAAARGTFLRRSPRAPRVAELPKPLALVGGGAAQLARDHPIDDSEPGEPLEHLPPGRAFRPSRLAKRLAGVRLHRHAERVETIEHLARGRPRVVVRTGGEVPRRVRGKERDRVEAHGAGTTAGTGGLAAS